MGQKKSPFPRWDAYIHMLYIRTYTVEPQLVHTSIIWTPLNCGHFWKKTEFPLYFLFKESSIMWTPLYVDTSPCGRRFFSPKYEVCDAMMDTSHLAQ